ncbi:MAG: FAD-binding oxidoreductase [Gemmatimonadaceae bacterium]
MYSEAAGVSRVIPRAIAVPTSVEEVIAVVAWARDQRMPVVPRGSGSGMAGGAVGDGVIVDLSRLRELHLDKGASLAEVGAGVTRSMLDVAARRVGLWFPVDPSSGAFCTLGGMAATNAAGPRSLKHGSMRAWVESLACVFADGTQAVVRRGEPPLPTSTPTLERYDAHKPALREKVAQLNLPAVRKDSSGYGWHDFARTGELVDLLVGSEGTLALITSLRLRLSAMPNATATILAAFPSLEGAVAGAALARDTGAAACELLDRTFLEVAGGERPLPVAADSEAVLLIELDAHNDRKAAAAAESLGAQLRSASASSVILGVDPESADELWSLRHAVSPILSRLPATTQSMQFIEDCAVPPDALPAFVRGVRAALDRHGRRGVIFGHAGDAHVHVNPLIDITLPDWRETVDSLLNDVVDLTARFGGTLSGEHGDGRLRAPLLHRTRDPAELKLASELKAIFDPDGLLNPGVKIPLVGQRPLEAIKYDPNLPPLPVAARRALDRVTAERAYDRSRLELLEEAD